MNNPVIILKREKRLVVLPTGGEYCLVWARLVLQKELIYELSLENLDDGGYTAWFAQIVQGKFEFISCANYMSRMTLLIRLAEEVDTIESLAEYLPKGMRAGDA